MPIFYPPLNAGLSNIGNTAGNTGLVNQQIILAGGNNITLSGSTNGQSMTITVSAPNLGGGGGLQSAGISNIGNTTGTSGLVSDQLVLAGGNNITLSQSVNGGSATVTISGASHVNRSFEEIGDNRLMVGALSMTNASLTKRPIFVPFTIEGQNVSLKTIAFLGSRAAGTTLNMTAGVAFYSMVNSTSLARHCSFTQAYSLTASGAWSGNRWYEFYGLSDSTLSQGQWWFALYWSGSNNSTDVANIVIFGASSVPAVAGYVNSGTDNSSATNNTRHVLPFWGVYSATTAAFPANVGRSDVTGGNASVMRAPYVILREI